ncbi:metal-sensitive transcriptional regulator [Aceticella autotrophica]|jgi:DNA-binding FrmR family transcriptional regulator|uniref:Metal-sensitive transcriptional regulator n=1 Tax=Aceticella autotrophica TaxID=2755338 RepID=A0A974Y2W7_9THEO|nr:metal-sensitive transcriptional regulator [Aceticella autotrophica]MDI6604144.1 metal-sensitive transcriptional regulator [Thermoanaerobacteraceae bacterium]QSZ26578.1 metal-sensitive transcriptional regulator [Aceticella autotrophica]
MDSYKNKKDDLIRRLRKIEGQVKGLQKMIDKDTYCIDVLVQVAAVRSAINSVGKILLKSYTCSCVRDAMTTEKQDVIIDELVDVFIKFIK